MPEPRNVSRAEIVRTWKQEGEEKRECAAAVTDCAACITAAGDDG